MKHVLVFDIGGTNLRMAQAHVEGREVLLEGLLHANTSDFRTSVDLWSFYCEYARTCKFEKVDAVCLAAAAPVSAEKASLSNARLVLDRGRLERLFQSPTVLVNDYAAAAFSLEMNTRVACVWGGEPNASKVRAVAGAGTGFGQGLLLPEGRYVPSEGGHAPFAFFGDGERAFAAFLAERGIPFPEVDDVVSGRGLEALALFAEGRETSAHDAGELYLSDPDRDGNLVGGLFARFFARACRTLALTSLCAGGLWLAGGIAMKNTQIVRSEAFHKEFVAAAGQHEEFLRAVPVGVFRDPEFSLKGAARIAVLAAEGKTVRIC